jgi:two-component system KDP operon response regulator KdpE
MAAISGSRSRYKHQTVKEKVLSKPTILIIDDESQIRKLLEFTLTAEGYAVDAAESARLGLAMASNHPPDLILLDLGLPDESGHKVLLKLRKWYTQPIIILSVQKREEDIVTALDHGANDYLTKPFRTGELLARIRSALRYSSGDAESRIFPGSLEIDLINRTVKKSGETIHLTNTEYHLLALLASNAGKVLTHQFLLRSIWGPGYVDQSQYLRVYVAGIRKKLEEDPNRPRYIITESGVGYRFSED